MKITPTKYNTNIIAPEFDKEDEEYMRYRYDQLDSLPHRVRLDLVQWLSFVCEKYWLDYQKLLTHTQYETWLLILEKWT